MSWRSDVLCEGSGWMHSLLAQKAMTKKTMLRSDSDPIVSW
jgi:hypothetical protein